MLLPIGQFGGIVPKIRDPLLLPDGKMQAAVNCRFDHGGIEAIAQDLAVSTPTNAGPLESLFLYQFAGKFLAWNSDVDALQAPLANDSFNRVYYTEVGRLKVTDSTLYNQGGTSYPMAWLYPSPPAPANAPTVAVSGLVTKFVPVFSVGSGPTGVLVTCLNASLGAISPNSQLRFASTGLTNVDGQSFNFEIKSYVSAPVEYVTFYIKGLSSITGTFSNAGPTVNIAVSTSDNISNELPAKVTHASHGLVNGDTIVFSSMVGMAELNNVVASVTVIDANNYTLDNIDSTAYGTFVSGTYQKKATVTLNDDPTLLETRGYVETYVNGYGEEGPPSPVSALIDVLDGDKVVVTDGNVATIPNYNIVSKRLYRLNKDASNNEVYQFVTEMVLATSSYSDQVFNSSLGEVLASTEWDAPPAGITGIIPLPNQTLAGFVGNLVCFSEPKYPHAWPASYQQAVDTEVMGLGSFGTSTIVLTQGLPYLITGSVPSNYVMDKLGTGYGCLSKRSVVQIGQAVMYAAPDGMVAVSTNGSEIATFNIFSTKEWQDTYNPSSIAGYFWEGKYVGFYTNGDTQAGFIYDPQTGDFTPLDFYATAGYHDPVSGTLYLVVGGAIVAFAKGSDIRSMSATTKRFRFPKTSIGVAKIIAASYPVSVTANYYVFDAADNTTVQNVTLTATSSKPIRHPNVGLVEQCDVTINGDLTMLYLAGNIEELPV